MSYDRNAGFGKDLSQDEADFNMVLPPLTSFRDMSPSAFAKVTVPTEAMVQAFLKEQDTQKDSGRRLYEERLVE